LFFVEMAWTRNAMTFLALLISRLVLCRAVAAKAGYSHDIAWSLDSANQCSHAAHQLVQQSLQNSACLGQHQGGVPIVNRKFFQGSWQTSNALALQAS
jgi:hypothetical protein